MRLCELENIWNQLTPKAQDVFSYTELRCINDLLCGLETAEDVNEFVEKHYSDEEE